MKTKKITKDIKKFTKDIKKFTKDIGISQFHVGLVADSCGAHGVKCH